jgi:hypothetical protein
VGSADVETSHMMLDYAHSVISKLTQRLAEQGATFLIDLGHEPRSGMEQTGLSIIFNWTVAEAINKALMNGVASPTYAQGRLLATIATSKTDAQIPANRRPLYSNLRDAGAVAMEFAPPGWSSAAIRRERQARLGDVLIAVSGGEGVEHLAQEYVRRGKPVIPLDIQLGASGRDGSGGAVKLFGKALTDAQQFFRVAPDQSGPELLDRTRTHQGETNADQVVSSILRLLNTIIPPRVFYVRLLNKSLPEYKDVECFFRTVVDIVVRDFGFEPLEMGTGENEYAWMNQAIFESLHHSHTALVDLTGVRANCFMELGYALGNEQQVLVTSQLGGAQFPFDSSCIEAYRWDLGLGTTVLQQELKTYWSRNLSRPPLVTPRALH